MTTIIYEENETEVEEKLEIEVTVEPVEEAAPEPEIFSLPDDDIDRVLAELRSRPKAPPDPCLLEDSSEDDDDEPVSEYQDSMDAAGYPYW
jgi:hypothetical protein